MSYTSFSILRAGRAYDHIKMGSDEWNALMARQQSIIAHGKGETVVGGWAAGIGKFVNVITYPNVDCSTSVIARLFAEQLGEVESSGPFVPIDDWMSKVSG